MRSSIMPVLCDRAAGGWRHDRCTAGYRYEFDALYVLQASVPALKAAGGGLLLILHGAWPLAAAAHWYLRRE